MTITAIHNIRKVTVTATSLPRQYKVVVTNAPNQHTITVASLGKQGLTGKSAYQLAVQNGFVGTELEWLNSLKAELSFNQETFENANGIILDFNLQFSPVTNKESVFLNGQKLSRTKDYNINSNIITFITAPISGDVIDIEYFY